MASAPSVALALLAAVAALPRNASAAREISDISEAMALDFDQDHADAANSSSHGKASTTCGKMEQGKTCDSFIHSVCLVFDTCEDVGEDNMCVPAVEERECIKRCEDAGAECCQYLPYIKACTGHPTSSFFQQDDSPATHATTCETDPDKRRRGIVKEPVVKIEKKLPTQEGARTSGAIGSTSSSKAVGRHSSTNSAEVKDGYPSVAILAPYSQQVGSPTSSRVQRLQTLAEETPAKEESREDIMQIAIMTPYGVGQGPVEMIIEASRDETISDVKRKAGAEGERLLDVAMPPDRLSLINAGRQLQDSQTLADYNIRAGERIRTVLIPVGHSLAKVAPDTMRVRVGLWRMDPPMTLVVDVFKSESIGSVKKKIIAEARSQLNIDVPADTSKVIYFGRVLEDTQKLDDVGVRADDTLHLLRPPRDSVGVLPLSSSAVTKPYEKYDKILRCINGKCHRGTVVEVHDAYVYVHYYVQPRPGSRRVPRVTEKLRFDNENLKNLDAATRTADDIMPGGYIEGDEVEYRYPSGDSFVAVVLSTDREGEIQLCEGMPMISVDEQRKKVTAKQSVQQRTGTTRKRAEEVTDKPDVQHVPKAVGGFSRHFSNMPVVKP